MNATSYKIADKLYLVRQVISQKGPPKSVTEPINHVVVLDCSGSMSGDLPKVRDQLKTKLPKLLGEQDSISIIWFSGRGEFGALLEGEPVATLKDLSDVQKAIDRWIRPIGLTGFKEPLEEAAKLIEQVQKNRPGLFSLFFMSDGCDNQWNRADILKVMEKTAGKLASATIVEYGYYADRALLAQMAEKAGGAHIFAESFVRYEPRFDDAMRMKPMGAKRVQIPIGGDPIGGFAWAAGSGADLLTFEASTGKAVVPEGLTSVAYLASSPVGVEDLSLSAFCDRKPCGPAIFEAYAAMALFSVRMKPDIIYPILAALGDVHFIDMFSSCFGKQKYSEFQAAALHATVDDSAWFMKGRDVNRVPKEDAFTVLDLLDILSSDEETRLLLDHSDFVYNRISRGRVSGDENLSAEEQEQIDALTDEMKGTKNAKKLKELQAQIDTILTFKQDGLKFVAAPAPDGYSISGLTYNEERPNISVLVKKTGTVNLESRLATCPKAQVELAEQFPTFIYRNYAIVKDGLVNVEKLPVSISADTYSRLVLAGVKVHDIGSPGPMRIHTVIDLKPLPVINRKMVKEVSAHHLGKIEFVLTRERARQKVFKHLLKDFEPKVSVGFEAVYGKEAATWLKEQGLTDYSGFSPKMVQAEAKDFYLGKLLEVKIKGYASLPSVADVQKRMLGNKELTGAAEFMGSALKEANDWLAASPEKLHKAWLQARAQEATTNARSLIYQKAKIVFGLIVGQVWFKEFKTLDENTLSTSLTDGSVRMAHFEASFEMKEEEIRI